MLNQEQIHNLSDEELELLIEWINMEKYYRCSNE